MKIDKFTNLVFCLGIVFSILSLTNLPIGIFNTVFPNIVIFCLVLLIYLVYLSNQALTKEFFLPLAIIFLFLVFLIFFWEQFSLEWSCIFFVLFQPLVHFNNKRLIAWALATKILLVLAVIVSSQLGLIQDVVLQKFNGQFLSHSMGFFHPNTFGALYFSVVLDIALYFKNSKKSSLLIGIALLPLSYFVYRLSYSRTSLALIFSVIGIFYLNQGCKKVL